MDLRQYDGKCVRIIDAEGNVFDGICRYDYAEYNEAEWGWTADEDQVSLSKAGVLALLLQCPCLCT